DHAGDRAAAVRNGVRADAEGVVHAEVLLFRALRDGSGREHARRQGEGEREPDLHGSPLFAGAWTEPAPPGTNSTVPLREVRRAGERKGSNGRKSGGSRPGAALRNRVFCGERGPEPGIFGLKDADPL